MKKQKMIKKLKKLAKYDCKKAHCAKCPFCIFDTCIKTEIKLRMQELKLLD